MFFKVLIASVLAVSAIATEFKYDCPSNGQHFFRYPYDCKKFVECNNGVARVADCIEGLYFSVATSFCDFPENVQCIVDEIPSPGIVQCPELNGEFATFLAHPSDCTKYYECNWGQPILMNCPTSLYFNPTLDVCDYPLASGCVQKS